MPNDASVFVFLRIGLNGFENPMRDPKVDEVKSLIGQGCKVKMDATGNILVKRLSRAPVYVHAGMKSIVVSCDSISRAYGFPKCTKKPDHSVDLSNSFLSICYRPLI